MSDKSADAVVLKNLWTFCCFCFFLILLWIVNDVGLFPIESGLPQRQTNCSVRESRLLDGPHSLFVAWEFLQCCTLFLTSSK